MNKDTFIGVIEDVNDPMEMGRLRVRIHGHHNPSLKELPTQALPWAATVSPVTSSSMAGTGSSLNVKEGQWVVGFFLDDQMQQPVVTGTINGATHYPDVDTALGFRDPFGDTGSGIDVPKSASASRFQLSAEYERRVELYTDSVVPMATHIDEDERLVWSLPTSDETVNPTYPNNKVFSSSSGHSLEMDDTPGFERVAVHHRSGSRVEWVQDGSVVEVVRANRYTVVIKDDNIIIEGNANVTVLGDARMYVKGDQIVEVDGDQIVTVHGDRKTYIGGEDMTEVTGAASLNIGSDRATHIHGADDMEVTGSLNERIGGSQTTQVADRASIQASRIDLN